MKPWQHWPGQVKSIACSWLTTMVGNRLKKQVPDIVSPPCHNCHALIHDLSHHFNGGLFSLSLGVLGENEREDFTDELRDVWLLPGAPGTPNPLCTK